VRNSSSAGDKVINALSTRGEERKCPSAQSEVTRRVVTQNHEGERR
jgi:hypothetical protein